MTPETACMIASMAADLLWTMGEQQRRTEERLASVEALSQAQQQQLRVQELRAKEEQRKARQELRQLQEEVAEMKALLRTSLPNS